MPVTVTVWAVSQSAVVKVNWDSLTVALSVSPEETLTVTSSSGSSASATVKVAVAPSATVTSVGATRLWSSTVTATVSSSPW